jgi:uncharacterized membrane protein YfcA
MDIVLSLLIILFAYFLKGFSGFGPALIMIPFLTIIYDPVTAIIITTLLDMLAGVTMTVQVKNEIAWSFVTPIILTMAIGAGFGAYLLGQLPMTTIQTTMAIAIGVFAGFIFFQKNNGTVTSTKRAYLKYPIGAVSGFLGGLLGISGPPLVIYMKLMFAKSFFRTQLIIIFLVGSAWRFVLYMMNRLEPNLNYYYLLPFILVMLIGIFLGHKVHVKVSETIFNRLVAAIILVAAIRMLI